jgi:outer membrane protein assembly factor BamD (BamD/ComL family)
MLKFNPSFKKYISAVSLAFILSGCGVWEDFTTYFNLYYNTKDKFQQAEDAIKLQRKNLFEFEEPIIPGNVPQLLNNVIEKSSKILQFHTGSRFVDDALLMLGKSFYYQKNYQKALRKFQELLVTHPESDLILENDLWIAKTQMRLKDFKNALPALKKVREQAIEEGEDEIIKDAFVEEIVHLIILENYPSAISLINEFLEVSNNDEVNAEVMYELGRLYIKLNDFKSAIASFEKVFDYTPSFSVELNSKIELTSALRKTDENEKALAILEGMRNGNKFSDSFDKIDLETGITLYSLGRVDESVDLLMKVDTTYASTTSSGIAKFKLGEIFEYHYKNFDSASYYYVKAASSTTTPEYSKQASEKSQLFKKYQSLLKSISDARKQLLYLENPDAFIQDSIAFYSDTLSAEEKDLQSVELSEKRNEGDEKGFNQPFKTQVKKEKKNPPVRPTISIDSVKSIIVKNEYDLANLFFTELNVADSGYYYYRDITENYPGSRYHSRSLYSIGTYYNGVGRKVEADSIFNFIYDNYKNENIVNAAAVQIKKPLVNLTYDPADELYVDAEKKLLEKKFDESVNKFYNIFQEYPKSPLAPKALYAGGWILENELKLLDSAAVFYDSINVKYPQSQYASKIKPKLTYYKDEINRRKKAIEDSLKQIELKKLGETKSDSLKQSNNPIEKVSEEQMQIDKSLENENGNEVKRKDVDENELKKSDNPTDIKKPEKQKSDKIK